MAKTELALEPPVFFVYTITFKNIPLLLFQLLSLRTFTAADLFILFFFCFRRRHYCDTKFSTEIKHCAFVFNTFLKEWEWITTSFGFDGNRSTKHWRVDNGNVTTEVIFWGAIDDIRTRNSIDIDFLGPFNWCQSLFERHLVKWSFYFNVIVRIKIDCYVDDKLLAVDWTVFLEAPFKGDFFGIFFLKFSFVPFAIFFSIHIQNIFKTAAFRQLSFDYQVSTKKLAGA